MNLLNSNNMTFKDMDIARLKFIMTMQCNFKCDYCFEGGKQRLHLSPESCIYIGKKILSEMKQDKLTVLYFGGEPLLRFQDIKLITQSLSVFAKKCNKQILFSFISNGTIMTDEFIKHFKSYNYFTSISCDGIKEAHNIHRGYLNGQKDSFERVNDNIDKLLRIDKELCLSMVVTNQNVKYLSKSFQWAVDKGIRNFAISPVLDQEEYTPNPKDYSNELIKIIEISKLIKEKITINPPLENVWFNDKSCRSMNMTSNSVNVELNPLKGLIIRPENCKIVSIDFETGEYALKTPANEKLRNEIIMAEEEASKIYKKEEGNKNETNNRSINNIN